MSYCHLPRRAAHRAAGLRIVVRGVRLHSFHDMGAQAARAMESLADAYHAPSSQPPCCGICGAEMRHQTRRHTDRHRCAACIRLALEAPLVFEHLRTFGPRRNGQPLNRTE